MTSSILGTVAPLFAIMTLGYLGRRFRVLSEAGVNGLVFFAFNFAIPSLLFRSLAMVALPASIAWGFLVAFYTGSFAMYGLGMAAGRFLFRRPTDHQAIFGMGAAFSNTVLLGIPIIITAFGPEATLPLFLVIAFHSATLMPLTVGIIQSSRGGDGTAVRQAGGLILELLRNPIIAGLLLGLVANLAAVGLPGPLDRVLELLGRAAVPCALFALGGSLGGTPLIGDVAPASVLALLKLVGQPLVVWFVAVPVMGLEGLWVPVAVTLAGMPAGVNVYLFGARYDAAPGVAARTVLLSSVASVVTIPIILTLVSGLG